MRRRLLSTVLVAFLALGARASEANPSAVPAAHANDNRVAAGELKRGVLSLHLELVDATWYPEQEGGPSIHVYAFAEPGRAPQIPGPLIRIPQGTEVHASLHNSLPVTVFVRGLDSHDTPPEPLRIAAGETVEVHFTAKSPGTYYYYARTTKDSTREIGKLSIVDELPMGEGPFGIESQLVGGFIVDAPGSVADDRVFIITLWVRGVITPPFREVAAINGKAWPYTERLSYRIGETARWRVLNPSFSDHAMHLHGFFYRVDSLGDGERDQIFPPEQALNEVTQHLASGATMALSWTPQRVGRWIFHCHMTGHMSPDLSLTSHPLEPSAHSAAHTGMDDAQGMGGLILGITVSSTAESQPANKSAVTPRQLRLYVRGKPATRSSPSRMGYLIQQGGDKENSDPPPIPGAPLVLTRGEPVEILVVNQLQEATAVHWHGIELESYYDGVPGWSGGSPQVMPEIPPGGTFLARMTPPRAGTFIYHTHWHDVAQLTSGLYGPLIVMEPGQKFDPDLDKTFIISRAGPDEPDESESPLLLNGTPQPPPMVLKLGTKYRLRFINISTNDSDATVSLLAGAKPVLWQAVAKDGWTLPAVQATSRPANQLVTVGETYDFEFVPEHPGELTLQVTLPFLKITISQSVTVR